MSDKMEQIEHQPLHGRYSTSCFFRISRGIFAMKTLFLLALLCCTGLVQAGERISIAAAADLRFALDEIIRQYRATHPDEQIEVSYGSSGKFFAQIRQGAPYDLFFSADISYPRELDRLGQAAARPMAYATGRIVLWSPVRDASKMTLNDLADPAIRKVAMANPQHAPYGKRAEEALKALGLWEQVSAKAVLGENISQTAQFVQTGNAEIGIIALSLAINPTLADKGSYYLIPDKLHQPLEQGLLILKRAADNPLARRFAKHMEQSEARTIMQRYGFMLPVEPSNK